MCPIQTTEFVSDHKKTQKELLKEYNIEKSFLVFHNFGSNITEFIELKMPYMMLYESIDQKIHHACFFEFTESHKNYINCSLDELNKIGIRPLHFHDFYELTIVLSGELQLQIEEEIVTYYPGDCCICNKNIRHRELFTSNFEIVLFLLTEDYVMEMLTNDITYDASGKKYPRNTFFHHLFSANNSHFYDAKEYIDFRLQNAFNSETYFKIFNNLTSAISSCHAGKSYLMKAYFCEFIELLSNNSEYSIRIHTAKLSSNEQLLYNVSEYMEQHPGQMKRTELSQALGYSADYINRIIKKLTGHTLVEYNQKIVLQIAADYLKTTNININEICEKLGYTNRSFFNKIFKDQYGVSPSKYRTMNRK